MKYLQGYGFIDGTIALLRGRYEVLMRKTTKNFRQLQPSPGAAVVQAIKITMETICSGTRSLESVHERSTNPRLKAGLITDKVAEKLSTQMTCEDYLDLSDLQLEKRLKESGLKNHSIAVCFKKRKEYVCPLVQHKGKHGNLPVKFGIFLTELVAHASATSRL